MKIYDLIPIQDLYNEKKDMQLPIKVSYKLSKLNSLISPEVEFFRNSMNKIIQEYAKTNEDGTYIMSEDGQSILIKDDKLIECKEKINELENMDINLGDKIKFTFEELEPLSLSTKEVGCLLDFIEE